MTTSINLKAKVEKSKRYEARFTSFSLEEVMAQIPLLIEDARAQGFSQSWNVEFLSNYPQSQIWLTFTAHGYHS